MESDIDDTDYPSESDSETGKFSERNLELTNIALKLVQELKNGDMQNTTEDSWKDMLALNKKMQSALEHFRCGILNALAEIQFRSKQNTAEIKQLMGLKYKKNLTISTHTGGSTYFKDASEKSYPNNDDYEKRSAQGEVFPMDFNLKTRHVWAVKDKSDVILGVKEQAQDYISTKKRLGLFTNDFDEKNAVVADLLRNTDDDFKIDWLQISAHNVDSRHSPTSCQAMWEMYLRPRVNRTDWTEGDTVKLMELIAKYGKQNWEIIAAEMNGRTMYQCYVYYANHVVNRIEKSQMSKLWSPEEKERLLEVIKENTVVGTVNWNIVASHFPNRSIQALQERHSEFTRPKKSKGFFTAEEDLILLAAVKEHGTIFSKFPRHLLPNRSIAQIRSHYYNTLVNRHKHSPWTIEDDKKLLDFVMENGTSNWIDCSGHLGNHNRTSCRTRYQLIKSFFEQHPESRLADIPRKARPRVSNTITLQNVNEKIIEYSNNPHCNFKPERLPKKKKRKQSTCANPFPSKKKKARPKGAKVVSIKEVRNEVDSNKTDSKENPIKVKTRKKKPKKDERKYKCPAAAIVERSYNYELDGHLFALRKKIARKDSGKRQHPIYINRLRNVGTATYKFFKYAYDYSLTKNRILNLNYKDINALAKILEFKKHGAWNPSPMVGQLIWKKQIPPNYATLMATRALLLSSEPTQRRVATSPQSHNESNAALSLFRNRFRTLFKETFMFLRKEVETKIGKKGNNQNQSVEETSIKIEDDASVKEETPSEFPMDDCQEEFLDSVTEHGDNMRTCSSNIFNSSQEFTKLRADEASSSSQRNSDLFYQPFYEPYVDSSAPQIYKAITNGISSYQQIFETVTGKGETPFVGKTNKSNNTQSIAKKKTQGKGKIDLKASDIEDIAKRQLEELDRITNPSKSAKKQSTSKKTTKRLQSDAQKSATKRTITRRSGVKITKKQQIQQTKGELQGDAAKTKIAMKHNTSSEQLNEVGLKLKILESTIESIVTATTAPIKTESIEEIETELPTIITLTTPPKRSQPYLSLMELCDENSGLLAVNKIELSEEEI